MLDVGLDGVGRHVELARDFLVGEVCGQVAQDPELALAERFGQALRLVNGRYALRSGHQVASGLLNTSQQIGGALGLAVLATIATTRTDHLAASHHPINEALTLGFHTAFLAAAGFVLLAIIAAASIGTRHVRHSQFAQPARRHHRHACLPTRW